MQKELREAFRLYDKQGNGFIPTTCLKEILKELDDQLTEQELDIMIEEIDSDGSGTVDFDGECPFRLILIHSSGFPFTSISISTHMHTYIYMYSDHKFR
uniref:RE14813p n=1 Tax=Drosophila melanogaster TaxID=7227 RepID=Q8MS39_DROME|nr:RE14813p [Drosophila melanogaster]